MFNRIRDRKAASSKLRSYKSSVRRFSGKSTRFERLESRELMAIDLSSIGAEVGAANLPSGPSTGPGSTGGGTSNGSGGVTNPLPTLPLTATFVGGVLSVSGTNSADNLYIFRDGQSVTVREVVQNRVVTSVPLSQLRSITVDGNAGDDWIKLDGELDIPATLQGELGNDILQGGGAGDTLLGGAGSDQLSGGGGDDSLEGGSGDDLLVGGDGNDMLKGGVGNDYLVGGDGDDWLLGEAGNDQLFGESGADMLFGGAGDDLLDGGDGDDQLYGDAGADALYGGQGNDYLRGLAGDDQLRGEAGDDQLKGDAGNDLLDGGLGIDTLLGDAGNDALIGGPGNDVLSGGADHDWMYGGSGNDVLEGGTGNDVLQGAQGADALRDNSGSNKIYSDKAPGQQDLEIQVRLFGALGDAVVAAGKAIANFAVNAINWTVDKISAVANDVYNWVTSLDDRLLRLSQDLRNTLSNWPWQKEFWKDLGHVIVDGLEVAGLGELWQITFEILKPWQRGLTQAEIQVGRSVFGDAIPWNKVRLDEFSLMAQIGRTHVTGFIINSVGDIDDSTMIHELTHVWQYVHDGLVYIPAALIGQHNEGYEYGGVADLRAKKAAGQGMSAYNPEQQGEIVRNYFELRQQIAAIQANGRSVPPQTQADLDVYIDFVREVSTLTRSQLGGTTRGVTSPIIDRLNLNRLG